MQHFKAREWNQAVAKLRRIKLLGEPLQNEPGTLDAHPLVRQYFKQQLKHAAASAWREGNSRLFELLKSTTKMLPDTVKEMAPLFAAVGHGCAAERHQEVLTEVYKKRIQRGGRFFAWNELGAFGAGLATLSSFFETPWKRCVWLFDADETYVLAEVGSALRAQGRLQESVQ